MSSSGPGDRVWLQGFRDGSNTAQPENVPRNGVRYGADERCVYERETDREVCGCRIRVCLHRPQCVSSPRIKE